MQAPRDRLLLEAWPFPEGRPYILRYAIYGIIGLFVILIGFSAFLWTRPLWRDLDRLTNAAERFGKGDLTSRVRASDRSAVSGLMREFNTMTGQIQTEISHRIELADAVSHELRTPLARLRFAFAMIQDSRDDHYHLNVEDDGCGIAEDLREKVFIPFTRLEESRDRESGNHGLGLAIVRSIVARHKGAVRVETSSMGGAAFRMSWPVVPEDHS
ncbi:MAG: hypothetical protein GY737_32435 [Desulfobacteraceae bacterium]|nr:hypothetical protein [Desulfobacteraceae bacterium]